MFIFLYSISDRFIVIKRNCKVEGLVELFIMPNVLTGKHSLLYLESSEN